MKMFMMLMMLVANFLVAPSAAERQGNNFKGFKDVCLKSDSRQGQDLALTVLFVPNSLDSSPSHAKR